MHNRRTDAEIVRFLRVVEKEGSVSKAAISLGLSPRGGRDISFDANARGLTAQSIIRDPVGKLKIENADLKAQLAKCRKEEDTAAAIREQIWKLEKHDPEPPHWLIKRAAGHNKGMPIFFGSDWHYGETVRPEEMGGLNEFNAEIAAKRIKRMTTIGIDLCMNHMGNAKAKYPGAVLAYGGDMISGDIHEELSVTNDRTPIQCVNDLTDLMAAQIETLATAFGKLHVPCVTGNHGRNTKRVRAKGRVFTSYEWNIYCNLKRDFRRSKNVTFQIPEQNDARFNVYGHRYLLTHGDMLGVKGGDGIIGALGPIRRGEIKVRNAESQINQDFDTMMIGHWHQYLPLPGLLVNNSLKGYDEFARTFLRAPYSRPSQSLHFVHPDHGVTAHWEIYLEGQKRARETKVLEWFE